MNDLPTQSRLANLITRGMVLLIMLMAMLVGIAFFELRLVEQQAAVNLGAGPFLALGGACLVVALWIALNLRAKAIWRSHKIAEKVDSLSRGETLPDFTHQERESLDPAMLTGLHAVSNHLETAKALAQKKVELLEKADLRDTQSQHFRCMVEDVITRAASGDFTERLTTPHDRPELKGFCDRINQLLSKLEESISEISHSVNRISEGEFSIGARGDFEGKFRDLETDLDTALRLLSGFMGEIQNTARSMDSATKEVVSGSQALSAEMTSQTDILSETSNLMSEISESIESSSTGVTEANALTNKAADQAEKGSLVVSDAISAMERIEGNSDRISDIISVIEGIAFQTNLLALNAAVEAARAGDAGKGFAVVASEVRNLAQRASDAAKDITDLIEQSSGDVANGVRLVHQSGDVLTEIAQAVRQVAGKMSEINDASAAQSKGIANVSGTISSLNQTNQANAELVSKALTGTGSLSTEVENLITLLERFSIQEDEDSDWIEATKALRDSEAQAQEEVPKAADSTDRESPPEPPLESPSKSKTAAISGAQMAKALPSSDEWAEF